MVTKEFAEASAEINEILKYLPKEEVEKIPSKLREFFKEVSSKDYVTNINPNMPLDKQQIKEKTKDIIALIYRNYWCSEEERKELDQKLIENDKKFEEELREKYNPDNIFKNNVTTTKKEEPEVKEEKIEQSLVPQETGKWYQRFLDMVKRWFKKK